MPRTLGQVYDFLEIGLVPIGLRKKCIKEKFNINKIVWNIFLVL